MKPFILKYFSHMWLKQRGANPSGLKKSELQMRMTTTKKNKGNPY